MLKIAANVKEEIDKKCGGDGLRKALRIARWAETNGLTQEELDVMLPVAMERKEFQ